jgi:two-component system chemotaxis response regulator CheY
MDVLLVDDSRVMRQLVRRTLRQAGFDVGQVVEAENGKDAIGKLNGWKPTIVLSDWNMPEMSGIEMLEALRSKGNPVPVGFVTSESTLAMRHRALEAGALFLLTKPFTAEDFRSQLTSAGIKPSGALTGSVAVSPISTEAFNERAVSAIVGRLVSQAVTVTVGPRLVPAAATCLSATWVNDAGQVIYGGFCDLPAAAYLGSAMGLRPVATCKDILTTRVFPEALQADVREVFNVLSRGFNDAGSTHVKLQLVTFPPTPTQAAALLIDKAGTRKDYMLNVAGYGAGKLSLVSADPKFIVS